jgi:hypothetical protein
MAVILRATAAEVNTVATVVERNSQVDVDLYGQVFPCPYHSRRSRANRAICLCGLRTIGRSCRPLSCSQETAPASGTENENVFEMHKMVLI